LHRDIATRHQSQNGQPLRATVDRAIERILFLKLCEVRGIKRPGSLRQTLCDLTASLGSSRAIATDILDDLYAPDRPYDFSVLPADILGRVYEQSVRADARGAGRKRIATRKTGGVYYTPAHIVDHIVEQSAGKLLRDRVVVRTTRAEKLVGRLQGLDLPLRVLDPACGGGSFLLGAYQSLLRWHLDFYAANEAETWAARPNAPIERTPAPSPGSHNPGSETSNLRSTWRLKPAERVRILLDHIHGVDIDPNAVEITRMSLLLMAFDGLAARTDNDPIARSRGSALPDLAANIKRGDALIGPDGEQTAARSSRPFDWHAEFPHVFAGDSPGFDAVIGNPPYVSYSGRQAVEMPAAVREYIGRHYDATGWLTTHGLFIQRGVRDLARRFVSFIVPDQVGHLDGYAVVRSAVAKHAGLVEVRYWGEDVFDGVVSPALTFVADRDHRGETEIIDAAGRRSRTRLEGAQSWHVAGRGGGAPIELRVPTHSLGRLVADPGVHTGNCSKQLIRDASDATPDCVPILEGKQVSRYRCEPPTKVLDLAYRPRDDEYFTIRSINRYIDAPFLVRQTAGVPIVGPRLHADYFRNSLLALYAPTDGTDARYLVGLLNSRLMRILYMQAVQESRQKAFPQVKVRSLRALPVRTINPSDARDRDLHDRIVEFVTAAMAYDTADGDVDQDFNEPASRIDGLVYELYDLTDDEIATIEREVRSRH
jgi:hypothetical protein